MKTKLASLLLIAALYLAASVIRGSTPEQEKAFTEKYKTAYEAKDWPRSTPSSTPRMPIRWRSDSTR